MNCRELEKGTSLVFQKSTNTEEIGFCIPIAAPRSNKINLLPMVPSVPVSVARKSVVTNGAKGVKS